MSINRKAVEILWTRICDEHLTYLYEEEGPNKFEMRKSLERKYRTMFTTMGHSLTHLITILADELKRFLGQVRHDRKFFLPATPLVLRRSISRSAECSMHKIGMGFVAIHHFAHNLFTKPWRTEYRTIKVYILYVMLIIENTFPFQSNI